MAAAPAGSDPQGPPSARPAKGGIARRALRIGLMLTLILVVAILTIGVAGYLLLSRVNLAPFVAGRAGSALGRGVTINGLHVTPGRWTRVDLDGVQIANASGGSRPAMVKLGHLTAEIDTVSLLRRPVVVRQLDIDALSILLERTARDRTPNWRFGPAKSGRSSQQNIRTAFPALLNAHLRGSEVTFRTAAGHDFRVRLDDATIRTSGTDQPVALVVAGAYNDTPITLGAELGSINALRDVSRPYGANLHFGSSDTALDFKGTLADPLNVDGARGTVMLKAPSPAPILAIAGVKSQIDVSLDLAGKFMRAGDLWQLSDATGDLKGNAITAAMLRLTEGAHGKPDDVAVDVAFDAFDIDRLVASRGGDTKGKSDGADIPLAINRTPDTLAEVHLTARQLGYARLQFAETELTASLQPGKVVVKGLALTYLGGRVKASGQIETDNLGGGHVSTEVNVAGAEVAQVGRALGFGPLPLTGRLDGEAAAESDGPTLNSAAHSARVSAGVSMRTGEIAREVIEMASTDVRLLFRRARGMTPVSCLLAVLDLRGGVGTLQPLRVRSATGAIAGRATLDLYRGTFDLTIGSEAATTSLFALDIPVRVSGTFANPTVRPARWSAEGRALLARTDPVKQLPPSLQQIIASNPCFVAR